MKNHFGAEPKSQRDARRTKPDAVFSEVTIVEFGRFETREAAWLLHSAVPVLALAMTSDAAMGELEKRVPNSSIKEAETGRVVVPHTGQCLQVGYYLV